MLHRRKEHLLLLLGVGLLMVPGRALNLRQQRSRNGDPENIDEDVANAALNLVSKAADLEGDKLETGDMDKVRTGVPSRVVKVGLPTECSICGSGMVDPFQEEAAYCRELYGQCKCCLGEITGRQQQICSQFMGYGDCIAGIKAAIEKKKAQCGNQQDVSDYNTNSRRQEISDAMRDAGYGHADPYSFHSAEGMQALNSTAVNSVGSRGPYDEACGWGDPNCEDNKGLCAHGYGCNYRLNQADTEYRQVKGWYEMYINTPCFSR